MKTLIKNNKLIWLFILTPFLFGCGDDDIVTLEEVVASFIHTIDQETRTVTFKNLSENASSYTWDLGDGTTSTLIDPVNSYDIGSYTIVLTAKNASGESATFEDTIIFLDQDIPLITLIGDAVINLTLGDTFTDPGATALDEVDGDITADIVVGGDTVDTNVEGTYTITYDVTDAQGNEAEQVVRTVNVTAISCVAETEGSLNASNLNLTFMSDPTSSIINDGANFSWVNNPDFDNSVNASCKVGQITKLGNNPWDNNQIDLDAKLDFNNNTGLKIKVWSPLDNTEVRVKLEEIGNPGNNVEQFLTTSVTNGWEELTFPFTSADSNRFDKIVLFFDLNANNTDTYYFDDLMLYGSGNGGTVCVPETTESLSASNFDLTFMSDPTASFINDGADFSWIDNPDFDNAVNSSCKVGQITKLGNNPWDNNQIDLDAKLDFNANEGLKIKVWSPLASTEVRIKLEEIGNPGNNVEQFLTTSITNGWEELTFPFTSADSDLYNKIVLFFDLNANNTDTYYFDDLRLYGSGGGTEGIVSIFHDDYTDIAINEWGPDWGPSSARIVDGTLNGSAAKVIEFDAGKVFAGIDFAPSAFDATNLTTFHMEYKVDNLLPGQVVNIKLSNHDGGNGETSAIQFTHTPTSTDVNTLSIPLADFVAASDPANLARNAIAQIVITGARADLDQPVYITIDSIYFSE